MFEIFRTNFTRDVALSVEAAEDAPPASNSDWSAIVSQLGGSSFDQGLYRLIRSSDASRWNARIAVAFPEFSNRVHCFGFDWLGRVFASDPGRAVTSGVGVIMFEPGTGDALEVPCDVKTFHEEELIEYRDAALASDFHQAWLKTGGSAPTYSQCIGYKRPLFLGGNDGVENMELVDLEVYWDLVGQLIARVKGIAPGTSINASEH